MIDCRAQLFVIQKRAAMRGVTFLDMLHAYTALDAHNARAREVRGYPAGDVPGWTARLNRKWAALGEEVAAFFRGERLDPFPAASHWAGAADTVRAWEVRVGMVKNRFVSERRTR